MDTETVAIAMALLPAVTLGGLRLAGRRRDARHWRIAVAFGISWLADIIALGFPPEDRWAVTLVYPVTQTVLIVAAFYPPRVTMLVLVDLCAVALIAVVARGFHTPDVLLHSAASLAVVLVALDQRETSSLVLRASLFLYFGLGLVAWLAHASWVHSHPDAHGAAPTWYVYQGFRLAGLALFSWSCVTDE